jgi:DNA sulfur modification protein DndD
MIELPFEHDITNADKKLLNDTLNYVRIQSKDIFESSINEINTLTNKLDELNLKLKRAEADLEDETIVEYLGKKDRAQFNITDLNRSIGQNIEIIKKAKDDSTRISHQLKNLVERVEINERNKIKILKCIDYQETLNTFLTEQKNLHKSRLEKTILEELKKLLHKLSADHNLFIEDVKVHLLANGQGMKITLYDQNDKEIRKESLSSGEKQIYISCLIKAILKESIQTLPIFIDTPLGRLDEEHRDNITMNYYPNLSSQVILFSTNSEITPKRFNEISEYTSKSYLLVNDGANTTIKSGYYK